MNSSVNNTETTDSHHQTVEPHQQQQQQQQQVVIMTHMADGLVMTDLERQATPEEVPEATATQTSTTMMMEDLQHLSTRTAPTSNSNTNTPTMMNMKSIPILGGSTNLDPDPSNHSVKSFGNSIKQRFSRKDSTPTSNASTPIHIPPATKAPKETLKAVYAAGKYKAGLTWNVLAVQSFMAGVYIAFAGQLYLSVGGGVLGAALFPGGLIAVILTSAELFTGDALIFVASVLGGQVPLYSLLRNWTVAWISNFIGCVAWAYLLGYLSDALVDSGADALAIKVAEKKALNDMSSIFIKAIGANFMVCVAVWQGTCAEEVAGKVLALWFPTAAFVMMGFDHVVANMFLIPVGMMLGANVSVGRMFAALFMATLGNAIGGGIFVGAVYWYVFDSMASFGGLTSRIRQTMRNVNIGRLGALHHAGSHSFRSNGWGHHAPPRPPPTAVIPTPANDPDESNHPSSHQKADPLASPSPEMMA